MIICTGFYHRSNLGDEIFHYMFGHIFTKINKTFKIVSLDDLKNLPQEVTTIILGGGEILNKYFMSKLIKLCDNFNGKIIAYSCELPIGDIIPEINLIDYFVVRNKNDYERLITYFKLSKQDKCPYIEYIPDIVFSLNSIQNICLKNKNNFVDTNKKITFCLARSIYPSNKYYDHYINKISLFIKYLKKTGWDISLYPFNTSFNFNESDIILNNDIQKICEEQNITVENIIPKNNLNLSEFIDQTISYIKKSNIVVCSRYHSHVLSILCRKPIISIPHTKKVLDQVDILNLNEWKIEPKLDECNRPIDLDIAKCIRTFEKLVRNYKKVQNKINKIDLLSIDFHIDKINNLLNENKRIIPPYYVHNSFIQNLISTTYQKTLNYFKLDNLKDTTKVDVNRICRYILYNLCKDPDAPYFWGLTQKICKPNFNYLEDFDWIIKDYYTFHPINFSFKTILSTQNIENKIFNLTYIEPHLLENIHRSGWYQVVQNTSILHNQNGIIFDMFVDKTFHWGETTYQDVGLIPYTKPWVGIVHHTPNENYTQYNTTNMINKESWIKSLENCIGIYTMSDWLTNWFKTNIPKINIETLIHPTEIPEKKFTFEKFLENNNKKIVQIGGWLRNCYSIYRIEVPIFLSKTHLIGKNMENYVKPNLEWEELLNNNSPNFDLKWNISHGIPNMNDSANKYVYFMKEYIKTLKFSDNNLIISKIQSNHNSVEPINNLSNEEYDDLLCDNIVFIDLIEASACNTLIECIVRNTPIVLRPSSSIVERLGPNYPLYWNDYDEIIKILTIENIEKAHQYIKDLDKSVYTFDYWIQSLVNSKIFNIAQNKMFPNKIIPELKQENKVSEHNNKENFNIEDASINKQNKQTRKQKNSFKCCFCLPEDLVD